MTASVIGFHVKPNLDKASERTEKNISLDSVNFLKSKKILCIGIVQLNQFLNKKIQLFDSNNDFQIIYLYLKNKYYFKKN